VVVLITLLAYMFQTNEKCHVPFAKFTLHLSEMLHNAFCILTEPKRNKYLVSCNSYKSKGWVTLQQHIPGKQSL
jgi:hypothetical protein